MDPKRLFTFMQGIKSTKFAKTFKNIVNKPYGNLCPPSSLTNPITTPMMDLSDQTSNSEDSDLECDKLQSSNTRLSKYESDSDFAFIKTDYIVS